ncbi:MAG: hypothetical protein C0475_07085 [Planctomyces sp.]|nr:hypothetical protein [Planctomyces sp.]MBA4119272.1 hypothetical protein [Isosphaera sp.]
MPDGLRIVYVSNSPPEHPIIGGRQRTNLLLRALRRIGTLELHLLSAPEALMTAEELAATHAVHGPTVFCRVTPKGARWPFAPVRRLYPRLIDRLAHNTLSRSIDFRLDPLASRPLIEALRGGAAAGRGIGLVVGRYLSPAMRGGAGEARRFGVPSILDIDDVETTTYQSRLEGRGLPAWERAVLRRHVRQLERAVPDARRAFDHAWVCSPSDVALVDHPSVSVLPNLPYAPPESPIAPQPMPEPGSAAARTAMVIASWNYTPNHRGLDRFLERVWPGVVREVPGAALAVAGSKMSPEQRERWGRVPGVTITGFLPSLDHGYRGCLFAVSPIYNGGGTKIKVIEALAHGRTCVCTAHSHRGYEATLPAGEAIPVAPDDAAMTRACVELFRQPARAAALGQAGRALIERHYSFGAFAAEVERSVERVLRQRPGVAG